MILFLEHYEIVSISHEGEDLEPENLLESRFKAKKYWDKYNNINTMLVTKNITKDKRGFERVTYPYRWYFKKLFSEVYYGSDDDGWDPFYDEGNFDFDLDIHYQQLINMIKENRNTLESI